MCHDVSTDRFDLRPGKDRRAIDLCDNLVGDYNSYSELDDEAKGGMNTKNHSEEKVTNRKLCIKNTMNSTLFGQGVQRIRKH